MKKLSIALMAGLLVFGSFGLSFAKSSEMLVEPSIHLMREAHDVESGRLENSVCTHSVRTWAKILEVNGQSALGHPVVKVQTWRCTGWVLTTDISGK